MTSDTKETNNQVQLQLTDLVSVLEALQLAASRGAYRPEEFTSIGGIYERIFTFLESTGAVSRPTTEVQPQGNQS